MHGLGNGLTHSFQNHIHSRSFPIFPTFFFLHSYDLHRPNWTNNGRRGAQGGRHGGSSFRVLHGTGVFVINYVSWTATQCCLDQYDVFCNRLREVCEGLGVTFSYNTNVTSLETALDESPIVITSSGERLTGDIVSSATLSLLPEQIS